MKIDLPFKLKPMQELLSIVVLVAFVGVNLRHHLLVILVPNQIIRVMHLQQKLVLRNLLKLEAVVL